MSKLIVPVLVLMLGLTQHAVVSAQVLNLVTLDNFKPLTWQEEGKAKGIDVEIVTEMCKRINVTCNISFLPWNRVLYDIERGKVDGGFAAFHSKAREQFAEFIKEPLHYSSYYIYVMKGKEFKFQKLSDLYGKSIGINLGFYLDEDFHQAHTDNKIHVSQGRLDLSFNQLVRGRIEGVIGQSHEVAITLANMQLDDQVVTLPKPLFGPRPAYLVMSKKAKVENLKSLMHSMNEALRNMRKEGFMDHINAKYLDIP